MKIQFDSTLQYQLDSIGSIVDIFQGQEKCDSNFTVYSPAFLNQQHKAFSTKLDMETV